MKSTFGKKVVTGVVAFASGLMMLGLVAVPAQAQTTEELQAQIAALLAQINQLQSQLSGTTSGSTSGLYCDFSFTRDLAAGSTGTDVMQLQKFLNSMDGISVAASGAGSAGIYTAALVFGGSIPGITATNKSFDGTNWTEVGDLNDARSELA